MAAAASDALEELIGPTVEAMGYDVVRVRLGGSRPPRLQVMVERRDAAAMTVDDCAAISAALSALLDIEDPLEGRYDLEVSSPGIDRPLVRLDDFARFAGFEAKLETMAPIAGRRRFRGRLGAVEADKVSIDLGAPGGTVSIPFAAIRDAKLVLTDKLIADSLKR